MFLLNYNTLFNITLVRFSFLALRFNSLFFTWVFMELNLIIVSPLLLIKSSYIKEQPSLILKYFLIQAMGSIFILASVTLGKHSELPPMAINIVLVGAIMLKAGVPPLHFWFPPIVHMANPYQTFILICVQKIIPLFLIASLASETVLVFIAAASVLGGISGINQNSIIKILAYSSIVHSGWILSGIITNPPSGYFYFLVYSLIRWAILKFIQIFKLWFISEVARTSRSLILKLSFVLTIFTLSGTPPFIGFFRKAYIIRSLMVSKFYPVILFLVIGSTLSFFFYTRLIVSLSIFNFTASKEKYSISPSVPLTGIFLLRIRGSLTLWLIS